MRHCSFYQQMKMISGDIRFTDSGKIQPGELDIKDESTFTNHVVWLFHSQDLDSNSPYCLPDNSYDVRFRDHLVLD